MMPKLAGVNKSTATNGLDVHETINTEAGLIVWGEPYEIDSWEATPGFLKKWAWAVRDCHELLASTNRWRASRGEKPLNIGSVPLAAGVSEKL